ncbi:multicopper oxidase family protein [Niveispirillum sp. KHB5.9]|uniref:multicopper oxidase family protein n=1 Tax=Niveispirillum sp. KHB5.9 TaxID=3400269 RepID=UPI003A8706D3
MGRNRNWRCRGGALLGASLLLTACGSVSAEPPRLLKAPDVLKPVEQPQQQQGNDEKPRGENLLSPGALSAAIQQGREIHLPLLIHYTDGTIYNPATGKDDKVRLRSYGDRFLAPTILMEPGQTVRISLMNRLPLEPTCNIDPSTGKPYDTNAPHCPNNTNLHSHGLWVSPTGNSDNVLLNIEPTVDFQYEYNVPEDHPAGTFWYHPHKHGSTSMQVGSGMAGALVIEGKRPPTLVSHGDLDTLLKSVTTNADAASQVMLIQQIPYACFDDKGNIEKDAAGHWICKDGQIGKVENFKAQFDPKAWSQSGRFTMFNGTVRPQMQARPGQLYRWRLIHAGVEETINLRIRKVGDVAKLATLLKSAKDETNEVLRACTGKDVSQYEVATDGLTRPAVFKKEVNNLQPGYRSDILFVLPEAGRYCVYDDSDGKDPVAGTDNAKIIGFIDAVGTEKVADSTAFVSQKLLQGSSSLPRDIGDKVRSDLADGLKLTQYVPHRTITNEEIKKWGQKDVDITFNINTKVTPTQFTVNGNEYDPKVINQTLVLGTAQQWILKSDFVNHPFHIHVNPFEVVSIIDKRTKQEWVGGIYDGMKGTWKDTLITDPNAVITVRTRYNRYIGEFVLHCHILDHEDQGMMQNVQIVLPGADGKPMPEGHH